MLELRVAVCEPPIGGHTLNAALELQLGPASHKPAILEELSIRF